MTTEIKYQLFCTIGVGKGYQVGELFDSEMIAKNHALNIKDRAEQEYKIISIVTTRSTLDIFTVPAHVPTLEEIAQDIICWSDGAYQVEWGEDFAALELADRERVEAMVWEEIASCDGCGWPFHVNSMEQHLDSGDNLCWKCEQDREELESEEDESDED